MPGASSVGHVPTAVPDEMHGTPPRRLFSNVTELLLRKSCQFPTESTSCDRALTFPFSLALSLSSWLSHLYPCCYHTASIWGFIGRFINLLFALLSHPNREKYKKRYKEERKGCIHQQYSYETKKALNKSV